MYPDCTLHNCSGCQFLFEEAEPAAVLMVRSFEVYGRWARGPDGFRWLCNRCWADWSAHRPFPARYGVFYRPLFRFGVLLLLAAFQCPELPWIRKRLRLTAVRLCGFNERR